MKAIFKIYNRFSTNYEKVRYYPISVQCTEFN